MFAIIFPSQLAFSVPSFSLRSTHLSDLTVTMTVIITVKDSDQRTVRT